MRLGALLQGKSGLRITPFYWGKLSSVCLGSGVYRYGPPVGGVASRAGLYGLVLSQGHWSANLRRHGGLC